MLKFPLKHKTDVLEASCDFATDDDISALRIWNERSAVSSNPIVRDAMEFSRLGVKWWQYYKKNGCSASSVKEIKEFVNDNPKCEVALCGIVKATWYEHSPVLGMCLFRRTWCNNLYINYLTAHPLTTREGDTKVAGIGSGLLYFIAEVAIEIEAAKVWGEATQNSVKFYEKTLGVKGGDDLILATQEQIAIFRGSMTAKIEQFRNKRP